jgi:hypothetical protein
MRTAAEIAMRILSRGVAAERDVLTACHAEASFRVGLFARFAALKAKLADLWPVTVVALALGVTLAWSGVLASLLWWGIEELI